MPATLEQPWVAEDAQLELRPRRCDACDRPWCATPAADDHDSRCPFCGAGRSAGTPVELLGRGGGLHLADGDRALCGQDVARGEPRTSDYWRRWPLTRCLTCERLAPVVVSRSAGEQGALDVPTTNVRKQGER